jgi:DNA repair ATPase RecN
VKITTVQVSNFKRVKDVRITPGADRDLILIGGKNGHGKSSTLDALTAAFGGKRAQPADPVRHGADAAEIIVELDGGLTIRRTIAPDGESTLEVRDELGAVKAPQTVLDKLVSGRFLDPLAFLALPAKDQRAQLMKMIEGAERIAGLNDKKDRAFTKRTEVGRDLTKAKGELERLPVVEPGTPIDVAELTAESKKLAEKQRAGDGLGLAVRDAQRSLESHETDLRRATAQVEDLERQLEEARTRVDTLRRSTQEKRTAAEEAKAKLDVAAKEWADLLPRREQVDADLARADKHNQTVYAQRAQMERRTEAAETVTKLDKEYKDLSKVIETIEARKAEILSAAKLPVEGLGIDDEGITLNGVPFIQASAAERLRVALGLAIAASPDLGDVWVRDGALLDDESLDIVAQTASAAGKRVWIERVGTKDPGVIVIQDGKVAS